MPAYNDGPGTKKCTDSGYIVWKDRKIVIFYSKDLLPTPRVPWISGNKKEAIQCVRGLGPIHRCTGTEFMTWSVFKSLVQYWNITYS